MEDSRQDLRTEFRAATESSGLACLPRSAWHRQAGFGLASVGMSGPEGRRAQVFVLPDSSQFMRAAQHTRRCSPCGSERRRRQDGSDRVANRSRKGDGPLRLRPLNVVPAFRIPCLYGVPVERNHVVEFYVQLQVIGHLPHKEPKVMGPWNLLRLPCQQRLEVLLSALLGMIADEVVGAVLPQREAMLGQGEILLCLLRPATDQGNSVFSFARREPCLPSAPRGRRCPVGFGCGPHPPVLPR
jgi:hypothetical protein